MSEQKEFEPILTEEEILIMQRFTFAIAPHNQRAQALLALNEGKTPEEAGDVAGLRSTQVSYWLNRYKKAGLAIFPEALLAEANEVGEVEVDVVETAVSTPTAIVTSNPAPSTKKDKNKKKQDKNKKSPKEKKPKKKKKADKTKKKEKKAKKDKKSDKSQKANKAKKKPKKEKSKKKK